MSALHADLETALSDDSGSATIFLATQITLSGVTLRLLDGSAEIDVDGETFTGEDPDYGTFGSIDDFEDGSGDEAPGLVITMLPNSSEAAMALSDPGEQGAPVSLRIGARDDATGLVIGEPYLLALCEIDVPVMKPGAGTLEVELNCVGATERFFASEEGQRLSPAFHKQVWPGELGCDFITGVVNYDYWGMKGNPGAGFTTASPGGAGIPLPQQIAF